MGWYAEARDGRVKGKAAAIAAEHKGARHVTSMLIAEAAFIEGKGVLVVLDNGPFEAAGFAFNQKEWDAFHDKRDLRPRQYVIFPTWQQAADLVGYTE